MYKFVLTNDGKFYVIDAQRNYHMDTGVPVGQVRAAGYFSIDYDVNDNLEVSLSKDSVGYGIGWHPSHQEFINKRFKELGITEQHIGMSVINKSYGNISNYINLGEQM